MRAKETSRGLTAVSRSIRCALSSIARSPSPSLVVVMGNESTSRVLPSCSDTPLKASWVALRRVVPPFLTGRDASHGAPDGEARGSRRRAPRPGGPAGEILGAVDVPESGRAGEAPAHRHGALAGLGHDPIHAPVDALEQAGLGASGADQRVATVLDRHADAVGLDQRRRAASQQRRGQRRAVAADHEPRCAHGREGMVHARAEVALGLGAKRDAVALGQFAEQRVVVLERRPQGDARRLARRQGGGDGVAQQPGVEPAGVLGAERRDQPGLGAPGDRGLGEYRQGGVAGVSAHGDRPWPGRRGRHRASSASAAATSAGWFARRRLAPSAGPRSSPARAGRPASRPA